MTGRVAVDHADLVAAVAQYEFPLDVEDGLGGTPIRAAGANGLVAALYIDGDHAGGPNVCGYACPRSRTEVFTRVLLTRIWLTGRTRRITIAQFKARQPTFAPAPIRPLVGGFRLP